MSALRGPGCIAGFGLLAAGSLGACTTPPPVPPAAAPVVAAPQRLDAQTVRLYLPPSVRTVGQAAAWLLDGSGYDLVLYCAACPPRAAEIAADPVSPLAYARPSELTSKTRALLLVLGGAGRVIIDDRLRLVTFDEEAG